MRSTDWTYLAQLARAMRQECVDGRIAGDFIAEIDAHLAESGVDPADEFGPPAALARDLASKDGTTRRFKLKSPFFALGVMFVTLLTLVVFAETLQAEWSGDIAIPASPIVYGAFIGGISMLFGVMATRRLDGRSWSPLLGWKSWLIISAIAIAAMSAAVLFDEQVLFELPASTAVALSVVGAGLIAAVAVAYYNPLRFPAHAQHLNPLRRGIWADRFGGRPSSRPSETV